MHERTRSQTHEQLRPRPVDAEEGSLIAEYGLLAVVGATIAGLAIKWASGGAIFDLLGAVLGRVKGLVGM